MSNNGNGHDDLRDTMPLGLISPLGRIEDVAQRVDEMTERIDDRMRKLSDLVIRLADRVERLSVQQTDNHASTNALIGELSKHTLVLVRLAEQEHEKKTPPKLRVRK